MDKYKVIALMGKSASGKDTILNKTCEKFPSLSKKVSTTTRPIRDGEKEGVDYFFVDVNTFSEKVLNFEILEANDFNDWFYGTEIRALSKDKINIGIFNPEGVAALNSDNRIELLTFYIIAPNKLRLIRSLNREANPNIEEIFRRYRADEEDFSDFDFEFIPLINSGAKTLDELIDYIRHEVVKKFG